MGPGRLDPEPDGEVVVASERPQFSREGQERCRFIGSEAKGLPLETAHEASMAVWGPVPRAATLEDALEQGQDGLFYVEGFLPAGRGWHQVEISELDARIELAAASTTVVCPLIGIYEQRLRDPGPGPHELELLGPYYAHVWAAELDMRRPMLENEAFMKDGQRAIETQRMLVRRLHTAGVSLLPGSASPNAWLLPGEALHRELFAWEQAGIPREAILASATRDAARTLGVGDKRGTIEAGKIADIVALAGDPRESLEHLSSPELVLLRGRGR